jgi:hypothetical protein
MSVAGDGKNFSTTVGMGMRLFTPGVCGALGIEPPGLSWGELVNQNFATLDSHTHAPGFGTQVPTAGMNINADLSFGGFNAFNLRSARFALQAAPLALPADVACIYFSGVDAYVNDANGVAIRLTSGGAIAGTPGSISGLASPAAVTYSAVPKLFTFTSSSAVAANLSCGPLSITDATVGSGKSATISVPAGLVGNYALVLPAALPGATSLVSLGLTGQLGVVTYPLLAASIANGTLTTTQLSPTAGIVGSQLAAAAGIVRPQLASVGQQVSASCGGFSNSGAVEVDVTNLTVTLTTTGRPVILMLIPDGASSASFGNPTTAGTLYIDRGGSNIAQWGSSNSNGTWLGSNFIAGNGIVYIDPVAAGTYTWKIRVNPNGANMSLSNFKLVAYEL